MTAKRLFLLVILIIQLCSCKTEKEVINEIISKEVIYPLAINEIISGPWSYYDFDLTCDGETDISFYTDGYSGTGGRSYSIFTVLSDEWKVKSQNKIDSICHISSEMIDGSFSYFTGDVFDCNLNMGGDFLRLDTITLVKIFKEEELIDNTIYNLPDSISYSTTIDFYEDSNDYTTVYSYSAVRGSGTGCDPIDVCTPRLYKSSFRDLSKGIMVFENQKNEKYGLKVEWGIFEEIIIKEVIKLDW